MSEADRDRHAEGNADQSVERRNDIGRRPAAFWAWEACVRRREFITVLGCAAAWPVVARAEPKMLAVGVLSGTGPDWPKTQKSVRAWGPQMKSRVTKRSTLVDGRKTSVSLEEEFWNALKKIAATKL